MSALAKLLKTSGYIVSGSDGVRGEETENLAFYGIKAYIGVDGARKELVEADTVVYTDAVASDNAELLTAKRLQKRIYARAELLQIVCNAFPHTLAVAGSHGKTTCTSMCAHILKWVGVPFTAHIGGEDNAFGNFYTTGAEYFVTEACEYKRNILKIQSETAVLLNIDRDHMECYENERDLIDQVCSSC